MTRRNPEQITLRVHAFRWMSCPRCKREFAPGQVTRSCVAGRTLALALCLDCADEADGLGLLRYVGQPMTHRTRLRTAITVARNTMYPAAGGGDVTFFSSSGAGSATCSGSYNWNRVIRRRGMRLADVATVRCVRCEREYPVDAVEQAGRAFAAVPVTHEKPDMTPTW